MCAEDAAQLRKAGFQHCGILGRKENSARRNPCLAVRSCAMLWVQTAAPASKRHRAPSPA